jgi:hypothetical protein
LLRSTVRAAAAICGLPQTTLQYRIKVSELCKVTSLVKPLLIDEMRYMRFHVCVSHVDRDTSMYAEMLSTVHVDERSLHVTEATQRFLLLPGVLALTRRFKSRRFITRVMVLAAVARPRVGPATQRISMESLACGPSWKTSLRSNQVAGDLQAHWKRRKSLSPWLPIATWSPHGLYLRVMRSRSSRTTRPPTSSLTTLSSRT